MFGAQNPADGVAGMSAYLGDGLDGMVLFFESQYVHIIIREFEHDLISVAKKPAENQVTSGLSFSRFFAMGRATPSTSPMQSRYCPDPQGQFLMIAHGSIYMSGDRNSNCPSRRHPK
jgi:hypothetical protein